MDDVLARLNAIHITLNIILIAICVVAGALIWGRRR